MRRGGVMGLVEMAAYFGGAVFYAICGTAAALILAWLAGRWAGIPVAALLMAVLTVIFLGLHPFPDPVGLDCSAGGARPILPPFDFIAGYRRWWRSDAGLRETLTNLAVVAPIMNVILFMPTGIALAGLTRRWWVALAVGMALTLFIEIAQLTALFGIYPCRYRHFETGDLLLNTSGVMLGFALVQLMAVAGSRSAP